MELATVKANSPLGILDGVFLYYSSDTKWGVWGALGGGAKLPPLVK